MEGGHPDVVGISLHERVNPVPHLPGRLVRERNGHNVPGGHPQFFDEVGHPVGQGPCLSGPRPGQDQHGPVRRRNRLVLAVIQKALPICITHKNLP